MSNPNFGLLARRAALRAQYDATGGLWCAADEHALEREIRAAIAEQLSIDEPVDLEGLTHTVAAAAMGAPRKAQAPRKVDLSKLKTHLRESGGRCQFSGEARSDRHPATPPTCFACRILWQDLRAQFEGLGFPPKHNPYLEPEPRLTKHVGTEATYLRLAYLDHAQRFGATGASCWVRCWLHDHGWLDLPSDLGPSFWQPYEHTRFGRSERFNLALLSVYRIGATMTLYQFFFEDNNRQPFWAWKSGWGNTRMLVHTFEEPTKDPPYYGNPRASYEVWKRGPDGWVGVSKHGFTDAKQPSWGTGGWLCESLAAYPLPPDD